MKIYKIDALQGNVSFTKNINAESFQDARNKFMLNNNKIVIFPFNQPEIDIVKITKRY